MSNFEPGEKPGNLGLLLPGGSCRCAFQAGVLVALAERGLHFDSVLGVSSGAWNAAAYTVGETERLPELWLKALTAPMFSRTVRQWKLNLSPWNFRWIHRNITRTLIDWSDIHRSETDLLVGLTAFPTMRPAVLSARENPGLDFFEVVLATNTLWPFYGYPTRVGGRLYLDGGFSDNAPIETLLERCSHVVAVTSEPSGLLDRKPMRPWGKQPPPDRVTLIAPTEPPAIGFNDFNPDHIRAAIDQGYRAGCRAEL